MLFRIQGPLEIPTNQQSWLLHCSNVKCSLYCEIILFDMINIKITGDIHIYIYIYE